METEKWSMNQTYYSVVSDQINRCLQAQMEAKQDPKMYDEWFNQIEMLCTCVGSLLKDKNYMQIIEKKNELLDLMGFSKNFQMDLDLGADAKKRFQIHRKMIDLQDWILRCAYKDGVLVWKLESNGINIGVGA